uniref:Uncharacterized protein n=1 Tax=Lepeophtheirus salmonis TaxID=72036 RepID=A0A0K2VJZ0_LEPSM
MTILNSKQSPIRTCRFNSAKNSLDYSLLFKRKHECSIRF